MTIAYKLLKIQHNYLKKQIFVTVNQKATKTIKKSQIIYEIRYLRRILQNTYQEKQKIKNSL